MTPTRDLDRFWELLEVNFPLGGHRKQLGERLGTELAALLEHGGILSFLRVADTYPCPQPGGAGCPMRVIFLSGGRIEAVCGNDSPECETVSLTAEDIEFLGVSPEKLCEALRALLSLGGRCEKVPGLRQVYHIGTRAAIPGTRQSVYLAVHFQASDYSTTLEALRSREEGQGFAVLVPTDQFLSGDAVRQMATLGIPVIPLAGVANLAEDGQLTLALGPASLLAGIGKTALDEDRCVLQNQGKTWLIEYAGIAKTVDGSKGMEYIACLLGHPREEYHATQLRAVVAGETYVPAAGPSETVLDDQAVARYRRELSGIEEDLDEARSMSDLGRTAKLSEDRAQLIAQIKQATGLGGKRRKAVDDHERARQSVSKAIHTARKMIEAVHPSLAQHLQNCLDIGEFLAYRPDRPLTWLTS